MFCCRCLHAHVFCYFFCQRHYPVLINRIPKRATLSQMYVDFKHYHCNRWDFYVVLNTILVKRVTGQTTYVWRVRVRIRQGTLLTAAGDSYSDSPFLSETRGENPIYIGLGQGKYGKGRMCRTKMTIYGGFRQ